MRASLHTKDSYLVIAVSIVTHMRFYLVAAAVIGPTAPPVAKCIKRVPGLELVTTLCNDSYRILRIKDLS